MRDGRDTESDALPTVTKEMIEAVAWAASSQPGMPFGMILTDEDIKNVLSIGIANAPPLQPPEPIGWWYQDSTACVHMSLDMDLGHRHERETGHALNLMYGKPLPSQSVGEAPSPSSHVMGTALLDVAAERRRQVEVEGWTPAHDDQHTDGSMAQAAAAYALKARSDESHANGVRIRPPYLWPDSWHVSWWKPKDRRRDLVRAAALIIAEIERLDRAALAATATEDGR